MILKRTYICTVVHHETSLTFGVSCVDLFCEEYLHCDGREENIPNRFVFEERYYETSTGQQIEPVINKPGIWIVKTDKGNWYVKEVKQ